MFVKISYWMMQWLFKTGLVQGAKRDNDIGGKSEAATDSMQKGKKI